MKRSLIFASVLAALLGTARAASAQYGCSGGVAFSPPQTFAVPQIYNFQPRPILRLRLDVGGQRVATFAAPLSTQFYTVPGWGLGPPGFRGPGFGGGLVSPFAFAPQGGGFSSPSGYAGYANGGSYGGPPRAYGNGGGYPAGPVAYGNGGGGGHAPPYANGGGYPAFQAPYANGGGYRAPFAPGGPAGNGGPRPPVIYENGQQVPQQFGHNPY